MDALRQTRDYVKKHYERRYRVTLRFTDDNVEEALEVYRFGVENALGITQAIESYYGYRYRRMENFLKECKLWKEKEGWLHWEVLTKFYYEYVGKKDSITVDVYIYHLAPEWLLGEHDIRECANLFWEIMTEIQYDWIVSVSGEYGEFKIGDAKPKGRRRYTKYGLDAKFHKVDYLVGCTQDADCTITIWRRGSIIDTVDIVYELVNYQIYGEIIC